ncbi:MAG: hypothetical protein LBQ03_01185 [Puniceicoccales bacterium]|jgi:hypothetical protein|nr:hypothetical protein [Puniceicoccales bacterium]
MLKVDVYKDEEGNLYVEDPKLHWINKFNAKGEILGFIDPVTKKLIPATTPEEIKYWNEWFKEIES